MEKVTDAASGDTLPSLAYTTGEVNSADGTVIGYRRVGHGPGLILVHGGMMASQGFMKLATSLADNFTVYVPDRRGRGRSGPHGPAYCLERESEDMRALVEHSGAQNIFGLSSGAIVALQSALAMPDVLRNVALYEPPLAIGTFSPVAWVPRYERKLAAGNLAGAMVTVFKGTGDTSFLNYVPRFLLVPLLRLAIESDAREILPGDVPIKALIPTMHYDAQLVRETTGQIERFRSLWGRVLLLGGSRSQPYLKAALDALQGILPDARRMEFPGVGHLAAENNGQPERVADELRAFFLPDGRQR